MGIGTSIVMIAIGAILWFAVTEDVGGIELKVVGQILTVLGIVGLAISIWLLSRDRDVAREREVVRDVPPRDRY